MSNNVFEKLNYPRVSSKTFQVLRGVEVPAKSSKDSGLVGKKIHEYIVQNLNINGNSIVYIEDYGIEIKTKNEDTNTDWSIGSMTAEVIVDTPYKDSPIYQKLQALLLITTNDNFQIISDVGLYYMDFDEIQLLIQDTYEDARSQLKQEVLYQQNSPKNSFFISDQPSELKFDPSHSFKGKHGRFEYTNSGTAFAFRIKAKSMKMFARMAASKPKADLFFQNI